MNSPLAPLVENKAVKSILNVIFKERETGKPGLSLSELSEKTGIERHRLTGMVDILTVLGLLAIFQVGMVKMVTVDPSTLKTLSKVLMLNNL
ncbi:hypothetical protein A3K63_02685 [Candidatus Micrarchaeota archaeon RBG_16_49_10]|nr:MAG: hypothetical protein A3K63_02685 [Candidatus Micrarchaeota archaeon RBG_16_49_10]